MKMANGKLKIKYKAQKWNLEHTDSKP